jgi:homoserine dehydrogenase
MLKPLQIGLIGFGTVGSSTYQLLIRNQDQIQRRLGRRLVISMVADLDTAKVKAVVGNDCQVVSDANEILANPDIDTVIELIGGYGFALEVILKAIESGKHVVTANKALLAIHGAKVFEAARKKGVMIGFEASVAGGIPIIKVLREGLSANRIHWIAGIINGTTNFILTQMSEKGWGFEQALAEAQSLGYAEADPTFDVQGIDAAHKCSILSAIAYGIPIPFDKAYVEGITQLQSQDMKFAAQLGYKIKLLGITKHTQNGIEVRVHPCLISDRSILAKVDGAMNAVMVNADALGTSLYYGKGAGGDPTASAVIADLIDISRLGHAQSEQRVPDLGFQSDSIETSAIVSINDVVTCNYLRIGVADQSGVLASITSILADHGISVDAMLQQPANADSKQTELIILTHEAKESTVEQAITMIQKLSTVLVPVVRIRKEDFN